MDVSKQESICVALEIRGGKRTNRSEFTLRNSSSLVFKAKPETRGRSAPPLLLSDPTSEREMIPADESRRISRGIIRGFPSLSLARSLAFLAKRWEYGSRRFFLFFPIPWWIRRQRLRMKVHPYRPSRKDTFGGSSHLPVCTNLKAGSLCPPVFYVEHRRWSQLLLLLQDSHID